MSLAAEAQLTGSNSLGGNITVNLTGRTVGALAIVLHTNTNATPPPLVSGWTNIDTGVSGSNSARLSYRYVTSGDNASGSYTFGPTGASGSSVTGVVIPGGLLGAVSTFLAASTTGTAQAFNALTPTDTNSLSLGFASQAGGGTTYTQSSGYTIENSNTTNVGCITESLVPIGTTSSYTPGNITLGTSKANRLTIQVEIKPTYVAQTRTLKWDIQVGATLVAATRQLVWDIQNMVAQQRTLKWDIQNMVAATRTLRYDIQNLVAATRTLKYDIQNLVAQTRTLKWDLAGMVSATRTLKWDSAAFVNNARTLVWNVGDVVAGAGLGLFVVRRHRGVRQVDQPDSGGTT